MKEGMRNEGGGGGVIDGGMRSVSVCGEPQNTTSVPTGTRLVTKACCLEANWLSERFVISEE